MSMSLSITTNFRYNIDYFEDNEKSTKKITQIQKIVDRIGSQTVLTTCKRFLFGATSLRCRNITLVAVY